MVLNSFQIKRRNICMKFKVVLDRIQKMDSKEFKKVLLDAGIIDKKGKLTKKYKKGT